jgi:hypothetical protein
MVTALATVERPTTVFFNMKKHLSFTQCLTQIRNNQSFSFIVVVIIIYYLFVLLTDASTGVYGFHGNATEEALLESPGIISPSTGLACEEGADNEAQTEREKTEKALRLNGV